MTTVRLATRCRLSREPVAVDQRRADALGERVSELRDVRRCDGAAPRSNTLADIASITASSARACFHRHEPERVREREVRLGVRVQRDDAEAVVARRAVAPSGRATSHAASVRLASRRDPRSANAIMSRAFGASACSTVSPTRFALGVHDANARALHRGQRRDRAHLTQPLLRARRQIEPSGIGAVDDVQVVVAGQRDDQRREARKCVERIEQLGPFGGRARVGQVARDHDRVERLAPVQLVETLQRLDERLVAARPGASAAESKAVALADDVDVREVRDAPRAHELARASGTSASSRGCGIVASASPHTSAATARYAAPTTVAFASAVSASQCGVRRSPSVPTQRVDGHTSQTRRRASNAQIISPASTEAAARTASALRLARVRADARVRRGAADLRATRRSPAESPSRSATRSCSRRRAAADARRTTRARGAHRRRRPRRSRCRRASTRAC